MTRLSRREQLMVGMALLVAFVLGGYLYLVEPRWAEIKDLEQDRIPAREQVLAKARARIAQREAVQSQLAEVSRAVEELSKRLLAGPTPPLAASELQKLVKELAAETDVEVRSERILPPTERGELLEVPLEITVSGGIREVVNLLYRLDGTTKLLTLRDLKIRVMSVGQLRGLLTTLTVSGFIRPSVTVQRPAEKPAGLPKG